MLLDLENSFSNAQAITTSAASTNVLKAGGVINEIAFGNPIPLRIQVVEDFTGCTSVEFKVQTATDSAFTTPVDLVSTGAVALAKLKAGYVAPILYMPKGNKGYLRIYYNVVGTATKGKVTAGIAAGHDNSYQDVAST